MRLIRTLSITMLGLSSFVNAAEIHAGFPLDFAKAEQGDLEAQRTIASYMEVMHYGSAEKWYKKMAAQGDVDAAYHLGLRNLGSSPYYSDSNYDEAVKWFKKAAEHNHPEALYQLGRFAERERDDSDKNKSVEWYLKAAQQGSINAQFRLGEIFSDRSSPKNNDSEAVKWFYKVAKLGLDGKDKLHEHIAQETSYDVYAPQAQELTETIWSAKQRLQQMLWDNRAPEKPEYDFETLEDQKLAETIWKAKGGDAKAQYDIGTLYFNRQENLRLNALVKDVILPTVLPDKDKNALKFYDDYSADEQAEKWYLRAADQGLPEAMYALAILERDNANERTYGTVNWAKVVDLFTRADELGYLNATYELSQLYGVDHKDEKRGYELKADPTKVLTLLQKAAKAGHYVAVSAFDTELRFAWEEKFNAECKRVNNDSQKILSFVKKQMEKGDIAAQYSWGVYLVKGIGMKKDLVKGKAYLDSACKNGFFSACADYDDLVK